MGYVCLPLCSPQQKGPAYAVKDQCQGPRPSLNVSFGALFLATERPGPSDVMRKNLRCVSAVTRAGIQTPSHCEVGEQPFPAEWVGPVAV